MILDVVATCIGCGCTDDNACPGGCSWLRIDYRAGLGVCSGCLEHEARWDAGDRVMTGELLAKPRESESLLLPGDIRFDDPFFPFPEFDDYEVALDLLP